MKKVYDHILDLIGNTPLVRIDKIAKEYGFEGNLLVKLESFNPGGSVKDRIANAMISKALQDGRIKDGATIIEPTSGNTGVGLAMTCAYRGYKAIFVMPETMSVERRALLKAYGAEIVLTPGSLGMKGAIAKANEIADSIPNSFIPSQFENPANPMIHKETTGVEIYEALGEKIDYFIAGVGTGGTISGVGEYLKNKIPHIQIIAVEPEASAVLSGEPSGPHKIQGIGAGFIPAILNTHIYDGILKINHLKAYESARKLAKLEGILVGISSGAALAGALELIKNMENTKEITMVVLLPDTGERYLSTELFQE